MLRIIVGFALIAILIGALYAGTAYWLALVVLTSWLCGVEALRLIGGRGGARLPGLCLLGLCFLVALFGCSWLFGVPDLKAAFSGIPFVGTNAGAVSFVERASFFLFLGKYPGAATVLSLGCAFLMGFLLGLVLDASKSSGQDWGRRVAVGIVFGLIPATLVSLLVLYQGPLGLELTLLLFASTALGDTACMIVGKSVQGPKIFPKLSPKKTWSGSIGGLVVVTMLGTVAGYSLGRCWVEGLLLGVGLAVSGQAGDAVESWAKRKVGVKNSGSLLPGHGGILDRMDSVLLAAPVMVLLLLWIRFPTN